MQLILIDVIEMCILSFIIIFYELMHFVCVVGYDIRYLVGKEKNDRINSTHSRNPKANE